MTGECISLKRPSLHHSWCTLYRAGSASIYEATCGGDGSATACYINNVINTPVNYTNAYFEISYVKVFSSSDTLLVPSTVDGSILLVSETATATASSSSSTSSSSSAFAEGAKAYAALMGATLLAVSTWMFL